MCEAARYEELAFVIPREFHRDVSSERGRAAADINRDVEHTSPDHAHEFRLGAAPLLKMEAPQYAVARMRFVVLHKAHETHLLVELPLRVAFEEVTPRVAENLRLENNHAFYSGRDDFHSLNFKIS